MTLVELTRLFTDPAEAGRRAQAARAAAFGRRVLVRAAPAHPTPRVAAIVRGDELLEAPGQIGHVFKTRAEGQGPFEQGGAAMPEAAGSSGQDGAAMPETAGSFGHVESAMTDGTGSSDETGDPGWPEPAALRPGDRVVVQVDHARLGAYFDYLGRLAAAGPDELAVAPVCARAGGLFRLHLLAAARLALPGRVRVEARHDLLGIRLAQVALAFGADTLSGPLAAARRLPLAGVPRPDEATPEGLAALVVRAGLEPVFLDLSPETLP